jgi:hypothetical protein
VSESKPQCTCKTEHTGNPVVHAGWCPASTGQNQAGRSQVSESKAANNTDREIYRVQPGDYYSDSIHVTEGGGIGINVGGTVHVLPLRKWHELAGGKLAVSESKVCQHECYFRFPHGSCRCAMCGEEYPNPKWQTGHDGSAVQPSAALSLAQQFHEVYERLAPQFGYETRKASAKPWADVPENNRKLMEAVCAEILAAHSGSLPTAPTDCCGDAHMELESALEHIHLLGFKEERIEKDEIIEILWTNAKADELREKIVSLTQELAKETERANYNAEAAGVNLKSKQIAEERVSQMEEALKQAKFFLGFWDDMRSVTFANRVTFASGLVGLHISEHNWKAIRELLAVLAKLEALKER